MAELTLKNLGPNGLEDIESVSEDDLTYEKFLELSDQVIQRAKRNKSAALHYLHYYGPGQQVKQP
jgi:hypothetical protein